MNRTLHVRGFELDSGVILGDVAQAYRVFGTLNAARDNAVFVFHSLTGSPAADEWWAGVVGPGCAIDTERYAVFAPNLLGSCYGTRGLPRGLSVTPRDMARLAAKLVEAHGITSVALATGGSLGGMVALEWAAQATSYTRSIVVFAAPAAHTAQGIGFNHVQRTALELGGVRGLALARMAAMLTYRTADQFEQRFGRATRDDGVFQVQSYLDHHGEKLVGRMDADTYRTLIDAMDAHDVGRGRGGVGPALRKLRGRLHGVGITGDLLYPPQDVRTWTDAAGAGYHEIASLFGHDAFLLEPEQVSRILRGVLAQADENTESNLLEAVS